MFDGLNKNLFLVALATVFVLGLSSGFAQDDAPVSIASSVDKTTIRIGDLIQYRIVVTHDPEVQIQLPGEGANLGGFDIRSYEAREPRRESGRIVTESEYMISTFMTGEFDIPPTAVLYTLPGDTAAQLLMTEPIHIVVESTNPSEEGDIRDIKAPKEIPRDWWILIRWIGLGLALLVFIILGWIGYRRRKAGKSLLPVREAPPRPPHEVALEALEALRGNVDGLADAAQIKQFYSEVSEIIRRYIEGRFYVMALEMTTREVLSGMEVASVEDPVRAAVQDFLEPCDLVKFAKFIPPESQHADTLSQAFDIVNHTKIILTAPVSVDGDGLPEAEEKQTEAAALLEDEKKPEGIQ